MTLQRKLQFARRARRGWTLIEALAALTVISILLAMSVPTVARTMEQAHADLAGANLKAVWNAQRFYWLEHRTYAADLAALEAAGLLDAAMNAGSGRYAVEMESADASSFVARATRTGSGVWSGSYSIDETGAISGTVQKPGADHALTCGFQ